MKRLFILLLALTMTVSLLACGNSGSEETQPKTPEGLQVGYAKINITPDYPVGLGGYSDAETRTAQGFIDYIYTICVAVTSGDETILIYTIDNCAAPRDVADPIREVVNTATGIAPEKIFIGATHGHNCPSAMGRFQIRHRA